MKSVRPDYTTMISMLSMSLLVEVGFAMHLDPGAQREHDRPAVPSISIRWWPTCTLSNWENPHFEIALFVDGSMRYRGSSQTRVKDEIWVSINRSLVSRIVKAGNKALNARLPTEDSNRPSSDSAERAISADCIQIMVPDKFGNGIAQEFNSKSVQMKALLQKLESVHLDRFVCPTRAIDSPPSVPPLSATGICGRSNLSMIDFSIPDPEACAVWHSVRVFPSGTVYYFVRRLVGAPDIPLTEASPATSTIETDHFYTVSTKDVKDLRLLVESFNLTNIPELDDVGGGIGPTYAGGTLAQALQLLNRLHDIFGFQLAPEVSGNATCNWQRKSREPSISFAPN